jgi:hypothetical protein
MIHFALPTALPSGPTIGASWYLWYLYPSGDGWLIEWEVLPQQIRLHPTGFDWFAEFSVFFEAEQKPAKINANSKLGCTKCY